MSRSPCTPHLAVPIGEGTRRVAGAMVLPAVGCAKTQIHGADGMIAAVRKLEEMFGEIATMFEIDDPDERAEALARANAS